MCLNIIINVPKLCVTIITKATFVYLEVDNVIDSGVYEQVLKPVDSEENNNVDVNKPDLSNVFDEGSVNSVPQVSGRYI